MSEFEVAEVIRQLIRLLNHRLMIKSKFTIYIVFSVFRLAKNRANSTGVQAAVQETYRQIEPSNMEVHDLLLKA